MRKNVPFHIKIWHFELIDRQYHNNISQRQLKSQHLPSGFNLTQNLKISFCFLYEHVNKRLLPISQAWPHLPGWFYILNNKKFSCFPLTNARQRWLAVIFPINSIHTPFIGSSHSCKTHVCTWQHYEGSACVRKFSRMQFVYELATQSLYFQLDSLPVTTTKTFCSSFFFTSVFYFLRLKI